MLRPCPSLEFSLSTAHSQSNAVVPYEPEASVGANQIISRELNVESNLRHEVLASGLQLQLNRLLDFAHRANDRERATVTLDCFLRQVQDERNELEVALEKQTTVRLLGNFSTLKLLMTD